MQTIPIYPFTAIVGQSSLKEALMLNAVNPAVGGVLIRGEKGTAKSTAVRALGALLPEIRVYADCPFSCDPARPHEGCDMCRGRNNGHKVIKRRVRLVTLPLNATEDRVAGGIDFNRAIKEGRRAVSPGLLARAHRGILYVDEVNLLDDHLVDLVLDAVADGWHRMEREGISASHPSRFILVGTMNPEEGELRPQLLDRFGLCVAVAGEREPADRVELMIRREAYDLSPKRFIRHHEIETLAAAQRLEAARAVLHRVRCPGPMRGLIAELCTENNVAGHRADLVMVQAAMARAALEGRREVTVEDISAVAPMVLRHRRRDPMPPPSPPRNEETPPDAPRDGERASQKARSAAANEPPDRRPHDVAGAPPENTPAPEAAGDTPSDNGGGDDQRFTVGATFNVRKIVPPRDRVPRRGSGRRSRTRTVLKQGRYVKSTAVRRNNDIALDATLRAAAPFQVHRQRTEGIMLTLRQSDIREKIREKRIGNFLVFLVDASGSMGARGRMTASKGAVMSLLLDAYQKRDKIAMITFRKTGAEVNLPPTNSVELAARLLAEMPVGGRTPLSSGLAACWSLTRNYLLKEPSGRPIVLIITDGKSNVAMGRQKPLDEVRHMAARMALESRITYIVVDTEEAGLVTFGLAARLAAQLGADYFRMEDLKTQQLVNIVKENR